LLLIASQFTFQYIREDKIAQGIEVKESKVDALFGITERVFQNEEQETTTPEQAVDDGYEEDTEEDMSPVFVSAQPRDLESAEDFISRILEFHPDPNNWYYDNKKRKLSSNEGLIAYNIEKDDAIGISRLAASIKNGANYDGKYLGKVGDRRLVLRNSKNEQ